MSHRGSSSFDVSQLASQSPPDLRVRSDMWKGQIPVMFHLAPHEVTSMEDPPPLAMLVPRMSYFPLVLADVRSHFRDMTPAMEDELWLEYEGIPLKWTIPIGVLFDALCPSSDGGSGGGCSGSSGSGLGSLALPWRLVVHFQSFPVKKISRCRALFTVRQHFVNTWKESSFLRFASNRVAQQCSPVEFQKMWEALLQLREDVYVHTTSRLVSQAVMAQQGGGGGAAGGGHGGLMPLVQAALENRSVESLAIRVYVHCTRPAHEEGMDSDTHLCPIQRPVRPKNASTGHEATLADLVQQVLPSLIDPASVRTATPHPDSPPSAAHSGGAAAAPAPSSFSLLPNVRLLVQGFSPPLSTPLWWLCTYCAHPDSFLYVALHVHENETDEERMARDPFGAGSAGGFGMGGMGMGMGTGMDGGMGMGMGMGGYGSGGGGGGMNMGMGMGGGGIGIGSGMIGSMMGLSSSLGSFQPQTLPGYHAASNAVNVVYQNLPSLPAAMSALPSVSAFFGATPTPVAPSTPQSQSQQQAEDETQQPAFSSAPAALDSPSSSGEGAAELTDIDAIGDDPQQSDSAPGSTSTTASTTATTAAAQDFGGLLGSPHADRPITSVEEESEHGELP